jgi:hypothetical protein
MRLEMLRRFSLLTATAAAVVLLVLPLGGQDAPVPQPVSDILTGAGGFAAEDLVTLQSGLVITRTASAPESLEASVVAAVRINTTRDRTADYFHQFVSYVDGSVTTGWGKLSSPPNPADFSKLTLKPSDLADLQECLPGDCALRIGITDGNPPPVDFTAADATARANTWMRAALAAYAANYLRQGNAALVAYDAQWKRVDMRTEWQQLVSRSTALAGAAPGLARYLTDFPSAPASQASDEIYWDQQNPTALKPTLGLTHWVTWRDPARSNQVVLAQKQFYTSHYLHSSLAVTIVYQDPEVTPATSYVVYFNRARGEILRNAQQTTAAPASGIGARIRASIGNMGAGFNRRMGEQMVRQSAERLLAAMKDALER